MQKKRMAAPIALVAPVALLALAACGAASAQSAVTLFGTVDAGLSYQSATSRDPLTGAESRQSRYALVNSGQSASHLGFRGREDLGGGLSAGFWLEAPLSNDDGGSGGGLGFSRRSTLSLSGAFGELRMGRDYTATYWNDTVFDPFGGNGSGANLIGVVGGGSGLGNPQYARAGNTVGYFLPPTLGGFYGQLQYGFHENTASSGGTGLAAFDGNAGRYLGGRFGYASGPLDVALGLAQSVVVDTAALARQVRTANLGASYDLGPVKLFGELSSVQDRFAGAAFGNRRDDYDGYLVGISVPLGAGLIRASYSALRYREGVPGLSGQGPRAQKFAIGYVYNLSKRTSLYATVARIANRNDPAYTGSLLSGSSTGFGGAWVGFTGLPRASTGYDFGIRHAF